MYISNPVYAGKIKYDNEIYEGKHPAIISYNIWKGTSQLLLLSGIIKCGYCESNMTTGYTTKNGKRHLYYQCTSVQKYGRC
jgi:site-specific DNA recombinase